MKKLISGYINFFMKNYKKLIYIPFILLFLSILMISYNTATTGSFVGKDVSLQGGLAITIDNDNLAISESTLSLEEKLSDKFSDSDFDVQSIGSGSILIHATDIEQDDVINYLNSEYGDIGAYTVREQSSQFGASFFLDTMLAISIAFIVMGLVVFIYFRTMAPSLAVILAALSDIVVVVAMLNVLGIRLSTSGVAALLMLIGYSVDTDILLSSKLLKKSDETFAEKLEEPMETGLLMTFTTIAAVTVGLIFTISPELTQIFTILLIGLLVDILMTYMQNTAILKLYLDRKEARK